MMFHLSAQRTDEMNPWDWDTLSDFLQYHGELLFNGSVSRKEEREPRLNRFFAELTQFASLSMTEKVYCLDLQRNFVGNVYHRRCILNLVSDGLWVKGYPLNVLVPVSVSDYEMIEV